MAGKKVGREADGIQTQISLGYFFTVSYSPIHRTVSIRDPYNRIVTLTELVR